MDTQIITTVKPVAVRLRRLTLEHNFESEGVIDGSITAKIDRLSKSARDC